MMRACFPAVQTMKKLSNDLLRAMYRQLYTIRVFETECIKLYRNGKIRGYFHPYLGEEAIAVGICSALRDQDYIISTHRGHGHCIARGATVDRMIAELLGKATGYCRGRGGSMHIADIKKGNMGANAIVGSGVPMAVGAALGAWIRGEDRVAVAFSSDGAVNIGAFGEAVNMAAIWNLPFIVVIENNQFAVSTPIEKSSRIAELYKRIQGFGIESWRVDGNDVREVYETGQKAIELCRQGKGPVSIEAVTYRHAGHHVNDPGTYMPKDKLDYYKNHDPVTIGRQYLVQAAGEADARAIEDDVNKEIADAITFAEQSPEPDMNEFLKEVEAF
jgi:pyruvate dehydrogenase E1 component alpha subunit